MKKTVNWKGLPVFHALSKCVVKHSSTKLCGSYQDTIRWVQRGLEEIPNYAHYELICNSFVPSGYTVLGFRNEYIIIAKYEKE